MPCGIADSVISDCSISGMSLVSRNTLLANVLVLDSAVVSGCGVVSCSGPTSFGNGMKLPLGLDGHGRETPVFASITVPEAAAAAQHQGDLAAYAAFVASIAEAVKRNKTVIR